MIVIVTESAPPKLRGTLTRWLQELKPNVFVGNVNALVRQKLWEKICSAEYNLNALMIFPAQTEQGYDFLINGDPERTVVDFDGVKLIKRAVKSE